MGRVREFLPSNQAPGPDAACYGFRASSEEAMSAKVQ